MTARRTIVWTVSTIVGLAGTVATIAAFQTTLVKFSYGGALTLFLSLGAFVFIWLDWILQTDYLKH